LTPIEVVTALIRDGDGRLLVVRKLGTQRFMLPGGKAEPGEAPAQTLARELSEELGVTLISVEPFGSFEAVAANEPGRTVVGHVHRVTVRGDPFPAAEIAEMHWLDPTPPYSIDLAPLLQTKILPALVALG